VTDDTVGHMLLGVAGRPAQPGVSRLVGQPAAAHGLRPGARAGAAPGGGGLAARRPSAPATIRPGHASASYVPNSVEGALGFMSVPPGGRRRGAGGAFNYGLKELKAILLRSEARLLITTEAADGGRLQGIQAMRPELPCLEDV